MKKLLLISAFLMSALICNAQNTTQVHATNGVVNIPATKVNGNVKIGLYTNNLSGSSVYYTDGTNYSWGKVYNKAVFMDHSGSRYTAGNALAFFKDANSWKNGCWGQSPSLNGDTFHTYFQLSKGTYDFYVYGSSDTSRGIQKWEIIDSNGNTNLIGSMDWYSAAFTINVFKTISVSISKDDVYKIQSTVTNKNALSSDYYILLQEYGFKRF